MIYKVLKKQNNSAMCFVCGIHNNAGLNTTYYEIEGNQLVGVFKRETKFIKVILKKNAWWDCELSFR